MCRSRPQPTNGLSREATAIMTTVLFNSTATAAGTPGASLAAGEVLFVGADATLVAAGANAVGVALAGRNTVTVAGDVHSAQADAISGPGAAIGQNRISV